MGYVKQKNIKRFFYEKAAKYLLLERARIYKSGKSWVGVPIKVDYGELKHDCELTNIYHLVDLCIATVSSRVSCEFKKDIDPALPDFKLPQNDFVKALTRVYESFDKSGEVVTELKLKTGEFLQIGGKRYQILKLRVFGEIRGTAKDLVIDEMCSNINIFTTLDEKEAVLNVPLILQ